MAKQIRDRQRIAQLFIAERKFAFEIDTPNSIGFKLVAERPLVGRGATFVLGGSIKPV